MKQEYKFDTQVERDSFIDKQFPERKMDDVPGGYKLPGGAYLGVFCNTVTYYPKESK